MIKDEMFQYFLEGIAMVVVLYEICRTGRQQRTKRIKRK